jgi:hypothetical protein
MRKTILTATLSVLSIGFALDAFAQDRFFTLSGGTRGDTANAKQESQITELDSRADKIDACTSSGKLYMAEHALADVNGCVDVLTVSNGGDVALTGELSVASKLSVGGDDLRSHALNDAPVCEESEKLLWTGTNWTCSSETDPKIAATKTNKWCVARDGKIFCDQEKPSDDNDVSQQVETFIADKVRTFARKDGSLASCQGGEVLIADGTTLSCTSLEGMVSGALILDDLSDVSVGLPQNEDILYFNGTNWTAGPLVENFSKMPIKDLSAGRCSSGDVLTFDGTQFACVPDIGGEGDALALIDLSDVQDTDQSVAGNVLIFDGTAWKPSVEQDSSVKSWAKEDIVDLVADKCDVGHVLSYDGTTLGCVPDAGGAGAALLIDDLGDVDTTTVAPVNNDILTFDGTNWAPASVPAEVDPNIQAFARNENPLPTCAANNIITSDGTALSCVPDAGSAADGLSIDDLVDVTSTSPSQHDVLVYKSGQYTNTAQATCGAGEVLTYNGTAYSCLAVDQLGLWADGTGHIARGNVRIIDAGQTMTSASLAGGTSGVILHQDKNALRVGVASTTAWDEANIGANSFATGVDAQAAGATSIALGDKITVSGANSVGINLDPLAAQTVALDKTMAIMGGKLGVGTVSPATALEVAGSITIGDGNEVCDATTEGAMRYVVADSALRYCNGTDWLSVVASGSGSGSGLAINDLSDAKSDATNLYLGTAAGDADVGAAASNVAVGIDALKLNVDGNSNVAIGKGAASTQTTGDNNIAIGANAVLSDTAGSNQLNIGDSIHGDLANKKVAIGGAVDTSTHASLDVQGTMKVAGAGTEGCDAGNVGVMRFVGGRLQICRDLP